MPAKVVRGGRFSLAGRMVFMAGALALATCQPQAIPHGVGEAEFLGVPQHAIPTGPRPGKAENV